MKLTGIGATTAAGRARRGDKVGGTAGTGFAQHLEAADGPEEAQGVATSSALTGMDALLAVQAVTDTLDGEGRRRLHRRGEDILDRLEEIRRDLLSGGLPKEKLMELARLVRNRRDSVQDPHLAEILDEIELRAEVEIAKLSRRP